MMKADFSGGEKAGYFYDEEHLDITQISKKHREDWVFVISHVRVRAPGKKKSLTLSLTLSLMHSPSVTCMTGLETLFGIEILYLAVTM